MVHLFRSAVANIYLTLFYLSFSGFPFSIPQSPTLSAHWSGLSMYVIQSAISCVSPSIRISCSRKTCQCHDLTSEMLGVGHTGWHRQRSTPKRRYSPLVKKSWSYLLKSEHFLLKNVRGCASNLARNSQGVPIVWKWVGERYFISMKWLISWWLWRPKKKI